MNKKVKKIVITGGHPSPAIAVIDQILESKPLWQLFVIGVKHTLKSDSAVSFEFKEIKKRNIAFLNITTGKLNRLLSLAGLAELALVPVGFIESLLLLIRIKPDIVLTFGGYISIPVALASYFLGIQVVAHEQTLTIGLANRIVEKIAIKVFLSWPQTDRKSEKTNKYVLTGLPLRKSILKIDRPDFSFNFKKDKKPLLYITGGSQGAHFINKLVYQKLEELLCYFAIIHQVGESTKYNDLSKLKEKRSQNYLPLAHIPSDQIGWVLNSADIIISRAGMNTICEILFLQKPAILIPLPDYINPEQEINANFVKKATFIVTLKQKKITPEKFIQILLKFAKDVKAKNIEFNKIRNASLQTPDAAVRIVDQLEELLF